MSCIFPDYAAITVTVLAIVFYAVYRRKSRALDLKRQELEAVVAVAHRYNALLSRPELSGKQTVTIGDYVLAAPRKVEPSTIPNRVKDAFEDGYTAEHEWYRADAYSHRKLYPGELIAEACYFQLHPTGTLFVRTTDRESVSRINDHQLARNLATWLRS